MKENFFPRTDLALESFDSSDKKLPEGVFVSQTDADGVSKTTVRIETEQAATRLRRPCGSYITLEGDFALCSSKLADELTDELSAMLPQGAVLVVGLGNRDITPDVIGPMAVSKVMATRHLFSEQLERMGLKELRSVCTVAPGVMGQTGFEAAEIIAPLLKRQKFEAVIAVDALAARSASRLCSTIQLCDSGIAPGSGVLNRRSELSKKTLGIPVIAIGIPTVIDAATLISERCAKCDDIDMQPMMVTPHGIDSLACAGAKIISKAINRALQPFLSDEETELFMS